MGRRGRAPEPTALRVLKGNTAHRPLNRNEPKPRPTVPYCPRWLDDEAKKEWRRIAPILHRLGLLTEADGTPLAAYCQAYSTWKKATETVQEKGITATTPNGYKLVRAEMAIAKNMMALIKVYCAEFGMTPSSRARMSAPPDLVEHDTLSQLLS